jgi:hypothetical protein
VSHIRQSLELDSAFQRGFQVVLLLLEVQVSHVYSSQSPVGANSAISVGIFTLVAQLAQQLLLHQSRGRFVAFSWRRVGANTLSNADMNTSLDLIHHLQDQMVAFLEQVKLVNSSSNLVGVNGVTNADMNTLQALKLQQ